MTQPNENRIVHVTGHGDFVVHHAEGRGTACDRCHFADPLTGGCMHPLASTGSIEEVCGGMSGYLVKVQTYDNDSQLGAGNG